MVSSKLKPSTKMGYWHPVIWVLCSPLLFCSTERLTQTLRNCSLYNPQLYETFKASTAHTAFSLFIPSFRAGRIRFSDHPVATNTKHQYNTITSEGLNFVGFPHVITFPGFQKTIVWISEYFFPMPTKPLAVSKRTNIQQHIARGEKRKTKAKKKFQAAVEYNYRHYASNTI